MLAITEQELPKVEIVPQKILRVKKQDDGAYTWDYEYNTFPVSQQHTPENIQASKEIAKVCFFGVLDGNGPENVMTLYTRTRGNNVLFNAIRRFDTCIAGDNDLRTIEIYANGYGMKVQVV